VSERQLEPRGEGGRFLPRAPAPERSPERQRLAEAIEYLLSAIVHHTLIRFRLVSEAAQSLGFRTSGNGRPRRAGLRTLDRPAEHRGYC
jgi:hypothetical protein